MKELLLFLAGATAATAATSTWTGSGGNGWTAASNWSPAAPVSETSAALMFDNTAQPLSTNDFSGGLTLNSLTIGANSGPRRFSGNPLIFSGVSPAVKMLAPVGHTQIFANLQLSSPLTVSGPYDLASQIQLRGAISGSNGITFKNGISTLQGANTFTGPILVSDGGFLGLNTTGAQSSSGISIATGCELQVHSFNEGETAIVNRPLLLSGVLSSDANRVETLGGTLPGGYYSGPITLTGDSRIVALGGSGGQETNQVRFVVQGAIARAGNLLSLEGLNAFSSLNCAAVTGNGTLQLTSGSINVGTVSGDGDVISQPESYATIGSLARNGALDSKGDLTVTGPVSGNRNLAVSDGTLRLTSTNSFTGSIVLSHTGALQLPDEAALGAASNVIQFSNGGRVIFTAASSLSKPMTSNGGTGWIETADSVQISSPLTGSGGFGIGSAGIATLTGNNPFTGGLSISGITQFVDDSNLGAAGGMIHLGGSLNLPSSYLTLNRPVDVQDLASITASGGTRNLSGNFTGQKMLTLGGPATYRLTGINSHSGGLAVIGDVNAPATLMIDSDARIGDPTGALNFGRLQGSQTLPAILRATGNLNIAATRSTTFRALTVDSNGFNVTFNQPVNGYGMTKTGTGTLRLNTSNPYTAASNPLAIQQGSVVLGVDHALGSRGEIAEIAAGGVLDLNGFDLEISNLSSDPGSEIKLASGSDLTLRNNATVDGSITGAGRVILGKTGFSGNGFSFNGPNSFSGGLTVREDMILNLGHASALGAPGNPITLDRGILSASSGAASPLVIDGSVNLSIGAGGAGFRANGQSILIQAPLTGSAPLRFLGGSHPGDSEIYEVRLLNPANSFSGTVQLGQADFTDTRYGIIGITADGCLGNTTNAVIMGNTFYDGETTRSSAGGLRAYADLTLPASRVIRLNGNLNGSGTGGVIDTNGHLLTISSGISELAEGMPLLKTGAGTLHLHGANAFTGELAVEAGTLGGTGSTAGKLRLNSSATLAPGSTANAIGTFTCRDLEMTSDAIFAIDLSSASGSDRLVVTGDAFVDGGTTLSIHATGQVSAATTFVILQKSGGDPVSGSFSHGGNPLQQGDTFTSGGIQWSISYTGGDGNDVALTALTSGGVLPATTTMPSLANVVISPAGSGNSGALARISAAITGGPANTSIFLEASSDLGQQDPWATILAIPLDASGGATISNATDPGSSGQSRNFFRLRTP